MRIQLRAAWCCVRFARGAEKLEERRLRRQRPALSVVVTDSADVANMASGTGFYVLEVTSGQYEMRCVHGLSVLVVLLTDDVLGVLESVAEAEPRMLNVLLGDAVVDFADLLLDTWRTAVEVSHG